MSGTVGMDMAATAVAIRKGEVGSREIVEDCLRRLSDWEPHVQALVAIFEEDAAAAARIADEEASAGMFRGPLHGVPVVIKDLIDMAGKPTEAGSRVLAGNVAAEDAAVVVRLRDAGAIIIGKSNTHEFAYGALTPPTRNPWNLNRMPGGSSGGSAAAVAAGEVAGAVGTDTAGSVREPAALCGTVGLKPTYGTIPCHGVVPLAWSLDTVGPLARTTADCGLMFDAMAGPDSRDPSSVARRDIPIARDAPLRVGVIADLLDPLEPEVERVFRSAIQALSDGGAEITEIRLADPDELLATVFVILASEASAYHRGRLASAPQFYGEDVRAYLETGMDLLAVDYVDAQRLRGTYRSAVSRALTANNYLLAPAQQVVAPRPDVDTVDFPGGREEPRDLTLIRPLVLSSLTGNPALSVPVAFTDAGLPVGVQLVGAPFTEHDLLEAGAHVQEILGWRPRLPSLPA